MSCRWKLALSISCTAKRNLITMNFSRLAKDQWNFKQGPNLYNLNKLDVLRFLLLFFFQKPYVRSKIEHTF